MGLGRSLGVNFKKMYSVLKEPLLSAGKSHFSPFHQEIQGLLQNKLHILDVYMKCDQISLILTKSWFCAAIITTHMIVLK